jgi:hypothetical protein
VKGPFTHFKGNLSDFLSGADFLDHFQLTHFSPPEYKSLKIELIFKLILTDRHDLETFFASRDPGFSNCESVRPDYKLKLPAQFDKLRFRCSQPVAIRSFLPVECRPLPVGTPKTRQKKFTKKSRTSQVQAEDESHLQI